MTVERRAPVQGFSAGIPWSLHLRAYDAYCERHGKQEALIDLEGKNCRGGFHTSELDDFIPGWREELSTTKRLAELEAAVRDVIDHAFWCHSVCAGAVPKTLLSKVRELSKQIPRQVSPQNDS